MNSDKKYMLDALKLATRGVGSVEPNPAVGCVIVKGGQIIGKGFHEQFGGPHAEINALNDCRNLGANPKGGTMYVTLEPCCHIGKTGPCTRAIIEAGITKVIAAMADPSQHACGAGFEKLKQAGIEVEFGLCQEQAKLLNAPFIKFATASRTWVTLKWAQTIDGKLAWANKTERWISSEQSRKDVQKLRGGSQAVLVGIQTVLDDDPKLTHRDAKNPNTKLLRVILDNKLRIPLDCKIVKTAKDHPVLVVTYESSVKANPEKTRQFQNAGVEILTFGDLQNKSNLVFMLDELSRRKIPRLLVESGPKVIASFLREGLADEICVYIAPKILGSAGAADVSQTLTDLKKAITLHHTEVKTFAGDTRIKGLTSQGLAAIS